MTPARVSDPTNAVVQGLWIGAHLSTLERLSIASFLQNGHEYHLYAYDDIENVPAGTIVRDGREILPASRIFQYRVHKSYSAFSNFFRYKLLLERGGWWADTDLICLRPFDLPREYVFSSEQVDDVALVNCGVLKVPRQSAVMAHAWSVCEAKQPEQLAWGEVGPKLLAESVRKVSVDRFVVAPRVFCPIGYRDWETALDPTRSWRFGDDVYAVHLWNEMWRRVDRDKEQRYPPGCLYEQLKQRYLVGCDS
jgi:Glycosyltransferase sugar-binding region containing DXD motif/Alpha 1,4-glycosyltransferase conserved region